MAFIIPNATDTASGAKYENLDQAEPDSLDFEILGNAGRSGVLSGCAVTALAASNTAVTVEGGVVVLNGQPYIVSGQSTFALPAAPTDARFDLIVARISGGTAALTTVSGNDELTNPEFPKSSSTLASGVSFDPQTNIDFTTDVVLASVYRQGTQNITTSRIADRRLVLTSSIVSQGTTAPSAGAGYKGSLYYRTNIAQGTTASGVYVKNSLGSWIELAQNTGPQMPVGSVIAWMGTGSVPSGFLEANGQVVSRSTYSDLFSVLGTSYGSGDGSTTFGLPDLNTRHLKGTTTVGTVGSTTGADTYTLSEAQLPSHNHSMGHTHTLAHTHGIGHNHNISLNDQSANHNHGLVSNSGNTINARANEGANAGTGGDHSHGTANTGGHNHSVNAANTSSTGNHDHNLTATTVTGQFSFRSHGANYDSFDTTGEAVHFAGVGDDVATLTSSDYYWGGVTSNGNTTSTGGHNHSVNATNTSSNGAHNHNTNDAGGHYHNLTANLNNQSANHKHNVSSINQTTNTSGAANETTTSDASSSNTGSIGSGSSINNVPASTYVRWLIRATGTINATAQDGSDILSEAREEVVTIELSGSGALPASQADAAYYRVPWAATLTAVKANRNGIDVNEGGTSVLSTEITIDQNEGTSLTAATPAVISDSAIANDALLTFDIDSANTSDEGPLTVTLYFTRED
jgi:microcystin-dependent protein